MDALLFASYGTTRAPARARGIDAVAARLAGALPGVRVTQAFPSPKVRRVLAERGQEVPDVAGALSRLADAGVTRVAVQPGHLVRGRSYELVERGVERVRDRFESVRVGSVLLGSKADWARVAHALDAWLRPRAGHAFALMGHGTDAASNDAYAGVGERLLELGRGDVLVGTFGATPGVDSVLEGLARLGVREVSVAPLMLTAGAHAADEMAGARPDSWRSRIAAAGYDVTCTMTGLGEIPGVQDVYVAHALEAYRALGQANRG